MEIFEHISHVAEENSKRVLEAFSRHRVSDTMFSGTTGYGYDDHGRDTLDKIYADVFGAEDALCRIQFVNGTHALFCALCGITEPGDTIISVTGAPYDTLCGAIGINGADHGTLAACGIKYKEVAMRDGGIAIEASEKAVAETDCPVVYIQRSRGYGDRRALSVDEIEKVVIRLRKIKPDLRIMVDNCYGEFCETREPTHVGVDIIAGSLIKNPGGGLAPTGGYIAGKSEYVNRAAERLTVPGIGRECGCTLGQNRLLYQGFFMAPHIVAQSLKTMIFAAKTFEDLGYEVSPKHTEQRYDIIQTIELGSAEKLSAFCRGIQAGAPCDSFVTPEAWDMPGYEDPVIMAAGAFVQGSSIELSADAPMRPPYRVYLQGGLTYESGKLGILRAVEEMEKVK